MLEEKIEDIIISVEQQITLIKIKLKNDKKDLKILNNMIKDVIYLDMERIQKDEEKLSNEIIELNNRIYKLNKILYRLRVCRDILNSEIE